LMSDFAPLFRSSRGIDHFMRTNPDGSHTFAASQDVTAVLEQNKAERNHNDGYSQDRTLRRAARIPYILMLQWLYEDGKWAEDAGHDPDTAVWLARKLNDPDYAYLRTADGQVAPLADGGFR